MELTTKVELPSLPLELLPGARMLFVGSCFADEMARRFADRAFRVTANPFGVMYNPVSIFHTVSRLTESERYADVAVLTLGTNRVYVLKETGEVVDNCQKRPARLFDERSLSVDECAESLLSAVSLLKEANPNVRVVLTVSPIRYRKYGYHGSRLSKATLLLAAEKVVQESDAVMYFPSYEIMNDELRDYRFYKPDMLHPSEQAVDYIYECFAEASLSVAAKRFVAAWEPLHKAFSHRPFDVSSPEYQAFLAQTDEKAAALFREYGLDWQEERQKFPVITEKYTGAIREK